MHAAVPGPPWRAVMVGLLGLSFFQDRAHEANQIEALRRWIGQLDLAMPTMFVTHQVVVTALSEIFPGSGEIVVMQRMADGRLAVQGRLPTA